MKWTSALAIYTLFWVLCAFVVLPFFARTHEEAGVEKIPGQADSAPAEFPAGRIVLWTTIVSAALFGLYYANYVMGWITPAMFDISAN
jgi:predicted secreted protein